MVLDESTRGTIEAFRNYIEELCAQDDRYGPAERHDRPDGSALATRFAAGKQCWFEVAAVVGTGTPEVRVGFVTNDASVAAEIEGAVAETEGGLSAFVGSGLTDAGLDWPEPPVEKSKEGDEVGFSTPLSVEAAEDLDQNAIRTRALRMLEGYLIAFGPAIVTDEEE